MNLKEMMFKGRLETIWALVFNQKMTRPVLVMAHIRKERSRLQSCIVRLQSLRNY